MSEPLLLSEFGPLVPLSTAAMFKMASEDFTRPEPSWTRGDSFAMLPQRRMPTELGGHRYVSDRVELESCEAEARLPTVDSALPRRQGDCLKTLGFDRPLYILPFDHRGSFQTKLFGWRGPLTTEQTARIAASKEVIYDGFRVALRSIPERHAGILVDEQFGSAILESARTRGYTTACPAEKSGQAEFDFEYGEDFAKHIERFQPTFCKVLVRYNPEGEAALIARQKARLKRLSDYLREKSCSRFMFELLVPPEKAQLARVEGDKKAYDLGLRPQLMAEAIKQLQNAGVEPDVWKIEGLDRRSDCDKIVRAARRGGRDKVGCVIFGRSEDDHKVHAWLETASGIPGFIGFAVGRTSFWDALVGLRAGTITRDEAVTDIARRYVQFVNIFEEQLHAA